MRSLALRRIFWVGFLGLGSVWGDEAEMPVATAFQIHCAACHAVDQGLVGPSLVEIAGIYGKDLEGFVKWSLEPQRKREGAIEMPAMGHVGRPTLERIHGYILKAAEGKTELKKSGGDPFGVLREMVRRPQVQRMFLPEASPAAIAVALPGNLSFCFDAGVGRLRYVWEGGFIDGYPYWRSNGSSLAKVDGEVVYREGDFPLTWEGGELGEVKVKFLGYVIGEDGLPTFRYRRGGHTITERISGVPEGGGLVRKFTITPELSVAVEAATNEGFKEVDLKVENQGGEGTKVTLTQKW